MFLLDMAFWPFVLGWIAVLFLSQFSSWKPTQASGDAAGPHQWGGVCHLSAHWTKDFPLGESGERFSLWGPDEGRQLHVVSGEERNPGGDRTRGGRQ